MFELRQKRRRFRAAVFEHPAHKASFVIGKRPIVIAHRKPSRATGAQGVGNTILLVFYWAPRCDTGRVFAILGAWGVSISSNVFLAGTRGLTGFCLAIG